MITDLIDSLFIYNNLDFVNAGNTIFRCRIIYVPGFFQTPGFRTIFIQEKRRVCIIKRIWIQLPVFSCVLRSAYIDSYRYLGVHNQLFALCSILKRINQQRYELAVTYKSRFTFLRQRNRIEFTIGISFVVRFIIIVYFLPFNYQS